MTAVGGAPVDGSAVSLRAVRKVFGSGSGEVEALGSVDADFGRGTFTAVMGPSGSGKSTLLQVAAGLDRPTAGEVLLAAGDPPAWRAPGSSCMPDESHTKPLWAAAMRAIPPVTSTKPGRAAVVDQ